ncbi:MAG: GyrI-like domain-containing protein [Candidatus Methanoperedens sp.]|nr:GyrI-like domain-containing protein [Candidatus Methanoperedens sp.]
MILFIPQPLKIPFDHVLDSSFNISLAWAKPKGLLLEKGARVFGRNTYPTDNPEPHGYEFFLTVGRDIESDGDIDMRQIPGGLYVVLRFKNLENIGNAREHLWNWIKENKYEYIGMRKGDHGWFNGFEEQINWHEGMPPNEWVFDLWVQLRE